MFMSIRRYKVDPAQREEVVNMVDEGWADHLRNEPGFLSYHVVATEEAWAELPPSLDLVDAAALPLVALTGSQLIDEAVRPRAGDVVLVTGAG